MNELARLAQQYQDLEQHKIRLEALAKQIKAQLDEINDQMLMYLDAHQMKRATTDYGTVHRRRSMRIEMSNQELACRHMYEEMKKAEAEGRPLADAIILQNTPHKGRLTEMVKVALGYEPDDKKVELTDAQFNQVLSGLGLKAISVEKAALRKTIL